MVRLKAERGAQTHSVVHLTVEHSAVVRPPLQSGSPCTVRDTMTEHPLSMLARYWRMSNDALLVRWAPEKSVVLGPILEVHAPGQDAPIARVWFNAMVVEKGSTIEMFLEPK